MGGTAWDCEVEWAGSVEASLDRAKREAFASGAYGKPVRGEPKGATPREVFERSMPGGTASILDVQDIGNAPGPCIVGPLPDAELQAIFGTTRPSPERADDALEAHSLIDRGEACYIIFYEKNTPVRLKVLGYSFD